MFKFSGFFPILHSATGPNDSFCKEKILCNIENKGIIILLSRVNLSDKNSSIGQSRKKDIRDIVKHMEGKMYEHRCFDTEAQVEEVILSLDLFSCISMSCFVKYHSSLQPTISFLFAKGGNIGLGMYSASHLKFLIKCTKPLFH